VPQPKLLGAAASAVILADRDAEAFHFEGLAEALAVPGAAVDVRLFSKPVTRPNRRMGVALALVGDVDVARRVAAEAAGKVRIIYGDDPSAE
jgi:phosphoribosylglycinamide formyltransferase 2